MQQSVSEPLLSIETGVGEREILSVSALASGLRALVETEYEDVWVEGELSNFKRHTSGHCYFTLKDADAQIRGVMWRPFTRYLFFQPRDGMLVRVHGQVSLYEQRGDVQLVVRSMQPAGEGALQKAFEALKRALAAEGLFDGAHKRPLPRFPESIGIVTSGSGAALHDMLTVLRRRFPLVRVLVCPVQVQGLGAAEAIADAIRAFDALPEGDALRPDLLIVGRGGGSIEDLWAFNEEVVARALFDARIPTVSAVGHETDVTIADFVADVRAATPSMAAEIAVPDRYDVEMTIRAGHARLAEHVSTRISEHRQHVRLLTGSYSFRRPLDQLRQERRRLTELTMRLQRTAAAAVSDEGRRLESLTRRLELLDPLRPLRRGYAWVEREGQPVRSAGALRTGDRVTVHFQDGTRTATVDPGDG